jgi:hypothetical protein
MNLENIDRWSKAEKDILAKYYEDGGALDVFVKLGRLGSKYDSQAIDDKAKQLGIKVKQQKGKFKCQRVMKKSLSRSER